MVRDQLQSILESLLFSAEVPLSLERLSHILEEWDKNSIKNALDSLGNSYTDATSGIQLLEVAGGWQLRSNPKHADYVRRISKGRAVRFSQSALETLAIIAYRQPITRAEIEYLRGVDCGAVLKNLFDKQLVKILGKKDIPGRPLIYGTSKEFLAAFSLKDLASLPTLKDVRELEPSGEQAELPLAVSDNDAILQSEEY